MTKRVEPMITEMNRAELAGVRVTCVAVYVPALSAAQRLRASGAEITVVEPPAGDPLEAMSPSWYNRLHEGVTTRRLDLKNPDGLAALNDLLAHSDVMIIAMRPSAIARLGLDSVSLHETHPNLCMVTITGHASPHEEMPGHDLTYQAARGLLSPPMMPRTLLADLAGAERAAYVATTLLFARARTGAAGHAVVSLEESLASFAEPAEFGLTSSDAPLGGSLPGYGLYATADGWIALAALEPHFWRRLCEAIGATDPDRAALEELFASNTVAHWVHWANEREIPLVAVRAT